MRQRNDDLPLSAAARSVVTRCGANTTVRSFRFAPPYPANSQIYTDREGGCASLFGGREARFAWGAAAGV